MGALNQLKFREHALYASDSGDEPCSGKDAYGRYGALVTPILSPQGVEPLLLGSLWLLGEPDEWDSTFVVRYPKASIFLELTENPAYHQAVRHRTAALADSRLLLMDFH
jgi:uncharacterized protein (DUF1330 family)